MSKVFTHSKFYFLADPSEIDVEGVTENMENTEKIKRKRKIKSEGNDGKKKRRRSPVKSSPYKNGCVMCPDLKVNSYKVNQYHSYRFFTIPLWKMTCQICVNSSKSDF